MSARTTRSVWTNDDKGKFSGAFGLINYYFLENSPKKTRLDWLKIVFCNSMETELARAVDVMIGRAKRIYILIIKVKRLFSFFSLRCFLKEIENMYSVFPSSYRNTCESLEELEKTVETLSCGSCSHSISRSPKLLLLFQ